MLDGVEGEGYCPFDVQSCLLFRRLGYVPSERRSDIGVPKRITLKRFRDIHRRHRLRNRKVNMGNSSINSFNTPFCGDRESSPRVRNNTMESPSLYSFLFSYMF